MRDTSQASAVWRMNRMPVPHVYPDMRKIVQYLLAGLLVVGVTAGCNDKAGNGGGGTNPGTGTSQDNGGGY